jgi:hypothetical protein
LTQFAERPVQQSQLLPLEQMCTGPKGLTQAHLIELFQHSDLSRNPLAVYWVREPSLIDDLDGDSLSADQMGSQPDLHLSNKGFEKTGSGIESGSQMAAVTSYTQRALNSRELLRETIESSMHRHVFEDLNIQKLDSQSVCELFIPLAFGRSLKPPSTQLPPSKGKKEC